MKTQKNSVFWLKTFLAVFFLVAINLKTFAQNSFFLKTSEPTNLIYILDENDKILHKIKSIYSDNVFLINTLNIKNEFLYTKEKTGIEICDTLKEVVIRDTLEKKIPLNLQTVFTKAKTIQYDADEYGLLEFIANEPFVKPPFKGRGTITFIKDKSKKEICYTKEFSIAWESFNTNLKGKIYKSDTEEIIWEKEKLDKPNVDYDQLIENLDSPLELGTSYVFEIYSDIESEDFKFKYLPFVVYGKGHKTFETVEKIVFVWCNSLPISQIEIKNDASKEVLWTATEVNDKKRLSSTDLPPDVLEKIIPKTDYLFIVSIEGEKYEIPFKVLGLDL
jgi:hypothetical protein